MSCCEKGGCNRRREEMLDISALAALGEQSAALIGHLLAVARTGVVDMPNFRDTNLQALAVEIQNLWLAAQAAKLLSPTEVAVDKSVTEVTLRFGPNKQYKLQIPVTGPIAKKELASALRGVADTLDPAVNDNQLPLPFDA